MLSRASQLTRLNAAYILRQLSVSPSNLSKQAHLSQKETTAYDESNQPIATLSSSTTTTTTTTTTSGVSSTTDSKDIRSATRSTGSNNRGANNSDQSRENWKPLKDIKSEIKRIKNLKNNNASSNRTTLVDKSASLNSEKYISAREASKSQSSSSNNNNSGNQVVYNQIITQISTCQDLPQLIDACQKLNNLNDTDAETAANFRKDTTRKTKVSKALLSHIEEMDLKSILTTVQFICRFDEASFDDLKPTIYHNLDKFTFEQLTKIIGALRTVVFYKPNASDTLREITDHVRSQIDSKLNSLADAKRALRTFASDSAVVKRIDLRISQLADKLTLADWIDLFNTKSVLRQRNVALLEICAYNIMKLATTDDAKSSTSSSLSLEHIQKCLLSCGILNYHETTFFKFLADQLHKQLDDEEKLSVSWMNENETCLQAIVNSVGMLQLRDEKMLDTLGRVLKRYPDRVRLVVSFVQACGALNYAPSTSFKQIVTAVGDDPVASGHFKLDNNNDDVAGSGRERHNYLNFVWSLCLLNEANSYLVASVLEKKFFDTILKEKTSKEFKSNLLKILNINMHSMLRMDNYEGPNLPEDFQLAEYAEILAPKKASSLNEALVSALAGFRSINKFVKLNLLTSFGILIDAFMIIDKNGAPLPLENYLGKESSSSDDEIRVAIKLIGYKDQTLINKQINGILMFQLCLLKEIGYQPLIIYQDELQSASLRDRVNLIEKKLIELARTKK